MTTSDETPPTGERLRIAVVGAGLGSAPHFKSLEDLAGSVDVAWVYARDPGRLAAMALPGGARRSSRFEDILNDQSVKAVLVLTPPATHLELARALASAGKHVLVEKPLDVSLRKAVELVETCEANGVQLAVMLQHRLREAARSLKTLVDGGELGQLVSARASVRWWRPQSYYDQAGRGTLARDGGGVLMTQAIHTLDLLLSLTGLPDRVSGIATTSPLHTMECEDTAAALLHYAGGAIGVVDATTAAFPGFQESIEWNGTLGSATLQGGELKVCFMDGRTLNVGSAETSGSGAGVMDFPHGPHRAVLQDFFSAVSNGTEPAISGRSALGVHRVIDAIMASASLGGAPVDLLATTRPDAPANVVT
ncbi:MAG: Gfo/Idh/MocA family oxidoreductase [Comamonadaceae bacterium]|nr:MAG: Gfo/Idh/MocA family oxidoreductase [Comamonadaceae bacterium]